MATKKVVIVSVVIILAISILAASIAIINLNPDAIVPEQQASNVSDKNCSIHHTETEQLIIPYVHELAYDGQTHRQLYVHRTQTDSIPLLEENKTTATPQLIASPNYEKYLFVEDSSIFSLDVATLTVTQVTSDNMDGYSKTEIRKSLASKENAYFVWAAQPAWSPNNKEIAYLSNRTSIGSKGGSIWIADLSNGSERLIYSSNNWIGITGWTSAGDILIWEERSGNLKVIDVEGNLVNAPITDVYNVQLNAQGNRFVYSLTAAPTEFWVYDLTNGSTERMVGIENGLQFNPTVRFSTNGNRVLLQEFYEDNSRKILVFDFETRMSWSHEHIEEIDFSNPPPSIFSSKAHYLQQQACSDHARLDSGML